MADQTKRNKKERDLPGYPHYSPEEDILKSASQVPLDIENISPDTNINTTIREAGKPGSVIPERKSPIELNSENHDGLSDNDVTEEDIRALGEIGMNIDGGDDEILKDRPYSTVAGDGELDIPGADLDDASEDVGSEDEENNYYSLGGDKD